MKITSLAMFSSVSLALLACGADDETPASDATAVGALEDDAAGALAIPPVSFRNCGALGDRDIRCAEIVVPVDHGNPGGDTIEIAGE